MKSSYLLKIDTSNLSAFEESMQRIAHDLLEPETLIPKLGVDLELFLHDLSPHLVAEIENLAPFGIGNPRPLFVSRKLQLKGPMRKVGPKGSAAWITDGRCVYEAVDFSGATGLATLDVEEIFDMIYSPVMNTWGGEQSISLHVKDIKISKT